MLMTGPTVQLAASLRQECLELLHVDRLSSPIYSGALFGTL
jgi:hypothetical protein